MCVDIDECTNPTPVCVGTAETCFNNIGSYICCSNGFEASSGNASCVDVDECLLGRDNCTGMSVCVNTMGGWMCECPPHYQPTFTYDSCEDGMRFIAFYMFSFSFLLLKAD